ncbi:MAG: hypothetical protein ACSHW4_04080 [Cellulophaga sp.]
MKIEMMIKTLKTVVGIGLILISFKSHSQTLGPLEVTPSNSGATLLVGRKGGNPSIKSSQLGSGHLILDSEFSKYVSLNHYTSDNVVLSYGGGNVGVGISNPKSRLHLYRGVSNGNPHGFSALTVEDSNNSMISILTPSDKTAFFAFSDSDDDYVGGMQYDHSNDRLVFRTNNHSSDLIINNNGNIGIGTVDTKGFKLGVKGKIAAEEVKVAIYNNWPDFIFEKNYDLPTLKEVENHIKKNGHLKDIPSAKNVKQNGILLGEMDTKLLQKIEELTLYTIQQQKEIEELKTLVKQLVKQKK